MDFMRNDVEYKNSYEWSTAKFTFTFRTRKTEPGLVTGGEEILLGHGIQMLAKKLSQEDACFGTMIWSYKKPSYSLSSSLQAYLQIYKGEADVRIRNNATSKSKFEGSILTVHPADQQGALPKTFGLALHHKTNVCGQPAY